jgi:hypothetical protein
MKAFGGSLVRTAIATGAVVGTALAGASIVNAVNAPDQTAIVHGCYARKDGVLRIVDPGVQCDATEVALDWLRAGRNGPTGPTGATGAPGDTGPVGPTGAAGADGRPLAPQRVTSTASGAGRLSVVAACPSGTRAASGGWSSSSRSPAVVLQSGPAQDAAGWRVTAAHAGRWTLAASAVCAPARVTNGGHAAPRRLTVTR